MCIRTMFYIQRVATGRFQFLPLILTLVRTLGRYPRKKDAFSHELPSARSPQIPHRFSSVVLSRIVISRRGICVLSRLMREKRICQEFNQLGRTLIAEWQLSCSRPSESLVVKHDGVFDTFLLASNTDTNDDGHVRKSFLKRNEVARFRRGGIITRRSYRWINGKNCLSIFKVKNEWRFGLKVVDCQMRVSLKLRYETFLTQHILIYY